MALVPTPEQQAIIQAVAHRSESIMITAFAGAAKTSSLVMAARALPEQPALCLAFNVKNKQDLEAKMPRHFKVSTLNGLGHLAWGRAIGKRIGVEERKLGQLVSAVMKEADYQGGEDSWTTIRQLVTAAMLAGLVPSTLPQKGLVEDLPEVWMDLGAESCDIAPNQDECALARQVLIESIQQAYGFKGPPVISFDEQIYLSAMIGGLFPRYPVVFVDEAQDLSKLNHIQVKRCAADRIIVVGDPKQAIYGFRGGDSSSMENMRAMRSSWIDLPLSLTFRCPQTIVQRQQAHAPGFRAAETNQQGQIVRIAPPEGADLTEWSWGWKDVEGYSRNGDEIAILCRNNAPLLGMAFALLRQGIGVKMLGRDIGKGLVVLSKKIIPKDDTPADKTVQLIRDWLATETTLAKANNKPHRIAGIVDRGESLLAVMEFSKATNAKGLRSALESLFKRENGVVTLASIHKAKGLEYDVVLHLDPWRIPSKFAKRAAEAGDKSQLQQENNLRYVCETRTKRVLLEANLKDFA